MDKILKFLQGKKGMIGSTIGATIAYLAVKGLIGEPEVVFFGALNIVFFGAASKLTQEMYKHK